MMSGSAKTRDSKKSPAAKPAAAKANAAPNPGAASREDLAPLQDQAFATAMVRNAYARERATMLMRTIVVLGGCLAMSVILNFLLALRPQEFRYIWTDSEGKIREIQALSEPSLSDVEIANWAAGAITQAYTINFAEFRAQMLAAQQNFTPRGWTEFQAALDRSSILQTIRANNYVMTAALTGAPVVEARGTVQGRYAWKLRFPIVVTFQSSQQRQSSSYTLEIVVLRMAPNENPRGVGIAQVNYL